MAILHSVKFCFTRTWYLVAKILQFYIGEKNRSNQAKHNYSYGQCIISQKLSLALKFNILNEVRFSLNGCNINILFFYLRLNFWFYFIFTLFKNGVLVKSYKVTPSHKVPSIKISDKNATLASQFVCLSALSIKFCRYGWDELWLQFSFQ